MQWEYATLEISAVAPSTDEPAEWQAYAVGPTGELIFEEYRPYRVAWARVFAEQLNRLGRERWELVGMAGPQRALSPTTTAQPSVVETRFVLRRPGSQTGGSQTGGS